MDQAIADRRLKAGQLVIVDEASLAGTFALDELVGAARQAGSKILLVGDGAQLGSVEAGGAFSLLVKDRGDLVAELTDVRRFSSEWEKAASIELRSGNKAVIDDYDAHGRITEGDRGVAARCHLRRLEERRRCRQVEPHDRRGLRHCDRAQRPGQSRSGAGGDGLRRGDC
jgi:ATP-dependent exoDNAse (exonuclease V) alpha subunit